MINRQALLALNGVTVQNECYEFVYVIDPANHKPFEDDGNLVSKNRENFPANMLVVFLKLGSGNAF